MTKQLPLGDLATTPFVAAAHEWQQKRKANRKKGAEIVETFALHCRAHKLPTFERELHFAKESMGRLWRFDFSWHKYRLAVEFEGLVVRMLLDTKAGKRVRVLYGRHATVEGFREDCEKYNTAALLGWTVLRFEREQIRSGHAVDMTKRVLMSRGWRP
jgi:hypothetical protein